MTNQKNNGEEELKKGCVCGMPVPCLVEDKYRCDACGGFVSKKQILKMVDNIRFHPLQIKRRNLYGDLNRCTFAAHNCDDFNERNYYWHPNQDRLLKQILNIENQLKKELGYLPLKTI